MVEDQLANPSVVSTSRTVALGSHEALIFPPSPGLALKKRYEQLRKQMNVMEHGGKLTFRRLLGKRTGGSYRYYLSVLSSCSSSSTSL